MLVIPQLRGDPEFLALDSAAQNAFERSADFGLVAVDRSAIKMPVADRRRTLDSRGNLTGGDVV